MRGTHAYAISSFTHAPHQTTTHNCAGPIRVAARRFRKGAGRTDQPGRAVAVPSKEWWAAGDSNHLPPRYEMTERCADTTSSFSAAQRRNGRYQACYTRTSRRTFRAG